jgi:hypothetical protein
VYAVVVKVAQNAVAEVDDRMSSRRQLSRVHWREAVLEAEVKVVVPDKKLVA